MKINLNELARSVTLAEGGKQSLSIAQVKEVVNLLLARLGSYRASEVLELVERIAGK